MSQQPIAFLDTNVMFCPACAGANDVRDPGTLDTPTPVTDPASLPTSGVCSDCSRPLTIPRLITAEERVDNVRASLPALTLQERPDPEAIEATRLQLIEKAGASLPQAELPDAA